LNDARARFDDIDRLERTVEIKGAMLLLLLMIIIVIIDNNNSTNYSATALTMLLLISCGRMCPPSSPCAPTPPSPIEKEITAIMTSLHQERARCVRRVMCDA